MAPLNRGIDLRSEHAFFDITWASIFAALRTKPSQTPKTHNVLSVYTHFFVELPAVKFKQPIPPSNCPNGVGMLKLVFNSDTSIIGSDNHPAGK